MPISYRGALFTFVASSAMLCFNSAYAQDAAGAAKPSEGTALQEIVVTAQKRTSTLLKVPAGRRRPAQTVDSYWS
jgi:hypothetical protein